jgi:hypothetical protein
MIFDLRCLAFARTRTKLAIYADSIKAVSTAFDTWNVRSSGSTAKQARDGLIARLLATSYVNRFGCFDSSLVSFSIDIQVYN